MKIQEALDTYQIVISNLSQETQVWYMRKLKFFVAWCDEKKLELEDIKPSHVAAFLSHMSERINPRTQKPITRDALNGYGKSIKVFLKWCAQDEEYSEYVKTRSANMVAVPKVEQKVIETFTKEEIKALFAAAKQEYLDKLVCRATAILAVLLDTGIRASELCGLTLGNVHIDPHDAYIMVMGKGRKEREIGLGKKARMAIHTYIRRYRRGARPEENVFLSRSEQPLTVNGLDQFLYRMQDTAGVKRSGAHKFRHTFAVNYLLAGGDVYKLCRLMGHTAVSTTERYVRSMKQRDARKGNSVLDNLM